MVETPKEGGAIRIVQIAITLIVFGLLAHTPVNIKNSETTEVTNRTAGQRQSAILTANKEQTPKEQAVTPVATSEQEKPESQPEAVAIPQPQPSTPEEWMNIVGLTESEKEAARYIIGQESGWCPTKWQGQYGTCPDYHGVPQGEVGYGLCQSTPATKMAEAGDDWATNPITQLKWCNQYVQAYGGWEQAAEFKRCTGWCYSTRILATTFKHTPWL